MECENNSASLEYNNGNKGVGRAEFKKLFGNKGWKGKGINATMTGTRIQGAIGQVCDFARAEAAKALKVLDEDYVIRFLIGAANGLLKLS